MLGCVMWPYLRRSVEWVVTLPAHNPDGSDDEDAMVTFMRRLCLGSDLADLAFLALFAARRVKSPTLWHFISGTFLVKTNQDALQELEKHNAALASRASPVNKFLTSVATGVRYAHNATHDSYGVLNVYSYGCMWVLLQVGYSCILDWPQIV